MRIATLITGLLATLAMTNVNAQMETKNMRIEKLVFEKIYPSDSTVEKFDYEMDFQRVTQAHSCALRLRVKTLTPRNRLCTAQS